MKLITWNIQWGRGADGRVDLDRVVDHALRFADFDVLCLQEVSSGYPELPGNDGADQFAGFARRLPGFAAIAGVAVDAPGPHGARRAFGNMLLSRLPVLQVLRHLLPWPADATVMSMQRVALEATLETLLGPLRVTTTHLEYYSLPQRRAQVERLRALQAEACGHAAAQPATTPADGPFFAWPRPAASLLAGDFNFLPDSAEHARLSAPFDAGAGQGAVPRYRDAWEVLHPGQPRPPTVGVHDKQQWPGEPFTFDHIFVSEDLAGRVGAVRVDAGTDASDHQPMFIELR